MLALKTPFGSLIPLTYSIGIGTADGQLRRIALPILGHPSEAITDQAGNLWFAQQVEGVGVSRILRLMPLGQLTIYTITGNGVPTSLAADRDGSIWFLRSVSALIWHLDPSGSISSFPSGVDRVADIAPDSQGGIWYISDGFSIGHLRTNGTSVLYPIPEALWGHGAGGIGVDSAGIVWFTVYWAGPDRRSYVDRMTATGRFTSFPLPLGITPGRPMQGADGAIWFDVSSQIHGPAPGRLAPDGSFRRYPLQPLTLVALRRRATRRAAPAGRRGAG